MARVFISYAHKDNQGDNPAKRWIDRMVEHLKPLEFDELIEIDTDRAIEPGDDWHREIQDGLDRADAAVLLVSPAFLASRYIRNNEVPVLLRQAQKHGLKIIPVILRPCLIEETRFKYPDPQHGPDEFTLTSLQAAGSPGQALNEMNEGEQDRVLLNVAQTLLKYAKQHGGRATPHSGQAPRIDLTHLPEGAPHFLGREKQLAALDAAWREAGRTAIVQIIAPGGVGKTALVKRWLDGLRGRGWEGARRVFGWSFYSQGTGDDRQASEDHFLAAALDWFGVEVDPALAPWDKGRKLVEAVAAGRTLLLLDGVEPLQYPPGPLAGELRAPGLKALLTHLATAGQPGLCVISSRERITDLDEYEKNDHRPEAGVLLLDLGNLCDSDGARLLHELGVKRAGAAEIGTEDEELKQASLDVQGHALTLSLLGRYLELAFEGDIRRRDQVEFQEADAEVDGGHAFKVMAAYETWFAREGQKRERELAALRLLGFFDRPASRESLRALRKAPAILGLTRPLVNLAPEQWRATLKRLHACGLVYFNADTGSVDAHPLVRQYLANTISESMPEAWREGHRRLYEQLKASVPHHPEGLAALQPLYQAVAHGCLAGFQQQACDEVYRARIRRGNEEYSSKKLGAFGADLGAVACFFDMPWWQPSTVLSEILQGWVLHGAAYCLRALGRLDEALEPMRAGAERAVKQEDWINAAIGYSNLSQMQLTLGRVAAAVADADNSVAHADHSGDVYQQLVRRSTLGDALHQHGETEKAVARFTEAEAMQQERQPEHPLLYSLRGFQYCNLLLAGVERAVWRGHGDDALVRRCGEVAERVARTLKWAEAQQWLLDIALDHLTLARCNLYTALLQGQPIDFAQAETDQAVAGLRVASHEEYIPHGLFTRVWLRRCLGDETGARADLEEVERIARRGNMRLHLADLHLTRARLFRDRDELAKARALIEECEYRRRLPELEDAERALS